jgi:hypothetical protein
MLGGPALGAPRTQPEDRVMMAFVLESAGA